MQLRESFEPGSDRTFYGGASEGAPWVNGGGTAVRSSAPWLSMQARAVLRGTGRAISWALLALGALLTVCSAVVFATDDPFDKNAPPTTLVMFGVAILLVTSGILMRRAAARRPSLFESR